MMRNAGQQRDRAAGMIQDPGAIPWVAACFAASLVYAVLRYNVLKGVGWEHLPLYVVNKAVALAAVFLLGSAYAVRGRRRKLGTWGAGLAGVHAAISLALLRPAYYEEFFGGAKMNLTGELSIFFGVIAAACIAVLVAWTMGRGSTGRELKPCFACLASLVLGLTSAHVFVMGIAGWLAPADWPGGMPPVSLLAFVAAAGAVVAGFLRGRRSQPAAEEGRA